MYSREGALPADVEPAGGLPRVRGMSPFGDGLSVVVIDFAIPGPFPVIETPFRFAR